MGSLKRKSIENFDGETLPPQKQFRDNGVSVGLDEPVACVHDVSYPEGYIPSSCPRIVRDNPKPAKEFPFVLDPFQTEAIKCLDGGESVMVGILFFKRREWFCWCWEIMIFINTLIQITTAA